VKSVLREYRVLNEPASTAGVATLLNANGPGIFAYVNGIPAEVPGIQHPRQALPNEEVVAPDSPYQFSVWGDEDDGAGPPSSLGAACPHGTVSSCSPVHWVDTATKPWRSTRLQFGNSFKEPYGLQWAMEANHGL
jgi:hypothetical protein